MHILRTGLGNPGTQVPGYEQLIQSPSFSGPEEIQSPVLLLEGPTSLCLLQPKILEAQEAEQELLLRVQSVLASVSQGYSIALLLRGRESEAPRLVLQLLQVLFETALPLHRSDGVLSTLSLVQVSHGGKARDLLSPAMEELSVLDVAPLGLVVEGASEVEVSDSTAASELYLQAVGGDSRDCPLLRVLAGEVLGEEMEGSLPWIVSQLLEGNNYGGLLLRLDPQGSSLSLLQAALQGASERRVQGKQVRPTLWNAVEETRARRAGLKILRLGLLGDTLTNSRLSQLRRALQELQTDTIWTWQVPDVVLQFFLAQARRQKLREQNQIWIQEELKHLEQMTSEQVKGLVAGEESCEERHRWRWEQTKLKLQVEALQAQRDAAEQDLAVLYHLVQATARTCHMLQVFRAWQALWEERAMTTEHRHRSLLIDILQDNVDLASQNQELQARNQELQPQQHVG
ncbi:LOW QUALITY PROTEIN: uncharacterized protein ACOB6Z_018429 [Ctenodactylus gundi]